MFNFEASKLPGPPGLPLRNRFQELVSDDESEDETHLQQQLPCCCPTTTHDEFGMGNKKNILKVIPGVDVPMTPMRSSLNLLTAEPVDMDIHPPRYQTGGVELTPRVGGERSPPSWILEHLIRALLPRLHQR